MDGASRISVSADLTLSPGDELTEMAQLICSYIQEAKRVWIKPHSSGRHIKPIYQPMHMTQEQWALQIHCHCLSKDSFPVHFPLPSPPSPSFSSTQKSITKGSNLSYQYRVPFREPLNHFSCLQCLKKDVNYVCDKVGDNISKLLSKCKLKYI